MSNTTPSLLPGSSKFSVLSVSNSKIEKTIGGGGDVTKNTVTANVYKNENMVISSSGISNAGYINGVIIENHSSRHEFNGSDPLDPGLYDDIKNISDNITLPGTSNKIPRADHVHEHGDRIGETLHAGATESISGFMSSSDKEKIDNFNASNTDPLQIGIISNPGSINNYSRADHVHVHGNQPGGSIPYEMHDGATEFISGFISSSDKEKIDNFNASGVNPLQIGIVGNPGIINNYSRADHVHAHGNQPSGDTLHADATDSVSGFISIPNKILMSRMEWSNLVLTLTGSISLTSPIYCRVTGGQSSSILQSGVLTAIPSSYYGIPDLNGILFSSNGFTILKSGVYNLMANPIINISGPTGTNSYVQFAIFRSSGGTVRISTHFNGITTGPSSVSLALSLSYEFSVGDVIVLEIVQDTGSDATLSTNLTQFSIFMLN
jgi:hypothetical protein